MQSLSDSLKACLVTVFKHYNTYFHILFHPHVFSQNLNNITRNFLPNEIMLDIIIVLIVNSCYARNN